MKTVAEFIASLPLEEQAFLEYMDKATAHLSPIKAKILLDGEVVETTMMVAVLWQTHFPEGIRVAKDKVGSREFSTVFLTVGNSNFETMCFSKRGNQVVATYDTLKEAQEGHAKLMEDLQ